MAEKRVMLSDSDNRVALNSQRSEVSGDTEVREAGRVWTSLGHAWPVTDNIIGPEMTTQNGLCGVLEGRPYIREDGAVAALVRVKKPADKAPPGWGIQTEEEKIIRGYNPNLLKREVEYRSLYGHILDECLRGHWDSVFAGMPKTGIVLDVGSGLGDHFRVLNEREMRRVIALDYMKPFVNSMSGDEKLIALVAVQGDWVDTGFPDESIAHVTGFNAITHCVNRRELVKVFSEFDRILKPGKDGSKQMSFIFMQDPPPENWGDPEFIDGCEALLPLESRSSEWYEQRKHDCIGARRNFLTEAKIILKNLGYQVDISEHTEANHSRRSNLYSVFDATDYQRQLITSDRDNAFKHFASATVLVGKVGGIRKGQMKESLEYYTIAAAKK
ncbi:MAG: class I SAM-dependent methyltransferase [Methanobacteriota archaeon]